MEAFLQTVLMTLLPAGPTFSIHRDAKDEGAPLGGVSADGIDDPAARGSYVFDP